MIIMAFNREMIRKIVKANLSESIYKALKIMSIQELHSTEEVKNWTLQYYTETIA